MLIEPLEPTATFAQSWDFPASRLKQVATYTCRFAKPFWGAPFTFHGNARTVTLPGPVLITETLLWQTTISNDYTMTGLPDVDSYRGSFALTLHGTDQVRLTWQISFAYQNAAALGTVTQLFAGASGAMTTALQKKFGLPQPATA